MDISARRAGAIGSPSAGIPPAALDGVARSYSAMLALSALAYAVFHHVGTLPNGLGAAVDGTRWADWIGLMTPYAVTVPAALALRAAGASAASWALIGVGGLAYAQGHGIHLASNSVGNAAPGDTAHLWDEVVGHYIWYGGVALVTAALALSMRGRARPTHPAAYLLALAAGLTWTTNGIGGATTVLSLLLAVAAAVFGWRHRRGLPVLLAVGNAPGAVLIAVHLSGALG